MRITKTHPVGPRLLALALALLLPFDHAAAARPVATALAYAQTSLTGPAGSGQFGKSVSVLANGNVIVTDPAYSAGSMANLGAVYLFDGSTGALISTLTGSTAGDAIGETVSILPNPGGTTGSGSFLVISPNWSNGAGAVTWCSETAGCTGAVSAGNSLVGSTAGDRVGDSITILPGQPGSPGSGSYVVSSPSWHNGAAAAAGAVTWCSGTAGCIGVVSAGNSLVGSTAGDSIGSYGITELTNAQGSAGSGSYVVSSPSWHNGAAVDAGAVTWCSGTAGCTGLVSAGNSLVGGTAGDSVGSNGITALTNPQGSAGSGAYVVSSPYWDNGAAVEAGAVTWCSGTAGCTGVISAGNSLVGGTAGDSIGSNGITALTNPQGSAGSGSYVVSSPSWDNGAAVDAGAATWCSGTAGCTGVVTASNSLLGGTAGDSIGANGITALANPPGTPGNGSYVVSSPSWDHGAAVDAGAATWCNGIAGCTGLVSAGNSLVGGTAGNQVGSSITALSGPQGSPGNGGYVVSSPSWDDGAAVDAGAATWCSGTAGCAGVVSASNSLVGGTARDYVGSNGITELSNPQATSGPGSYVVSSPYWDNGGSADAGAVTWCSGAAGCTGLVSAGNSLVGGTAGDSIGSSITALAFAPASSGSGSYVVASPYWDNGAAVDAGAATWCSGTAGCAGVVSASNSLVGGTARDYVGSNGITELTNPQGSSGSGSYVVASPYWDNGAAVDAGAATWCSGAAGCTGLVSAGNSLVGGAAGDRVGDSITTVSGPQGTSGSGDYVVSSPYWDNGAAVEAGAVTWCSGTMGCTGVVSAGNSLVGGTAGDSIGSNGITELPAPRGSSGTGSFVVSSPPWTNGAAAEAGAVSWCREPANCLGPVSAANSFLGSTAKGGWSLNFEYDSYTDQLVIGRPADNRVTLFKSSPYAPYTVFLPAIVR